MEHRWGKRLPVCIDVLLYHNHIPVSRCKTRDVGSGGMTLVGCGTVRYSMYTSLEVEFELNRNHRRQRYRLPVLVIHNFEDEIGVMFSEADAEVVQVLWRAVQSHSSRPSARCSGGHSTISYTEPLLVNSPSQ